MRTLFSSCSAVMLTAGIMGVLPISAQDVFSPGFVKREVYADITGTTVADLTTSPNYPGSPTSTTFVPGLETPVNVADNYGVRLSGFIVAQETGSFEFYISADDGAEFWLSTDETPARLALLCTEPQWNNPREWPTPGSNAAGRDLTTPENKSAPVSLTKGQRYYFEALMKEGGGGDNLAVTLAKAGTPAPAAGTPPVWGSWVGANIPQAQATGATVQITLQPQDVTTQANQDVTFTVAATGSSPANTNANALAYEWRRNGVPILGQTGTNLVLQRVQLTDSGTKISAMAAVAGATVVSSEATLTVTPDTIKPSPADLRAGANLKSVTVTFSEWVDPASATNIANYGLSGGVTVSGATLVSPNTVKLATTAQAAGASHTLTINNVQDTANNPIEANTQTNFTAYAFLQGRVLDKFWNLSNNSPAGLRALPTYPDQPEWVRLETQAEYPADGAGEGGVNYGNTLEFWWTVPSTGEYVLYCNGDDGVELYLSTDDDPANAKLIAQEAQWSNPRTWLNTGDGSDNAGDPTLKSSATFLGSEWTPPNVITLTGGSQHYVLAVHSEGGGGDNVGVTFAKSPATVANGDAPAFTADSIGFYYDPSLSKLTITQQPTNQTVLQGRKAMVSIGVTGGWQYGPPFYQWQQAPSGSTTFTNVPGAAAAAYETPVLQLADTGMQFRVDVSVPGMAITSAVAVVTVIADTQPPAVTRAKATSTQTLALLFDEDLDKTSAETVTNYTLSDGVTVLQATNSGNSVLLTTSGLTNKKAYTLTLGGVKDIYNNMVTAGTTFTFVANIITYADVILADNPIAFYRFEETTGQTTKNFGSLGTAADGLYMTGNGPDDSAQTTASVAPGPRPGAFVGFDPNNNAVIMDGMNTLLWIDTQGQLLNGLPAFSLEYWVKPANRVSDPATFGNRIGLVGQNDAVEYGFITPNTIQIWTSGGGSLDTAYSFPDNEWHHVATIADGTNIKNYFDGVLVGTGGSATGNYGSSAFNVHIGGGGVYDGTGNFFTGQFDEVAIFNKAIPAARIVEHFKAGREGGEAPAPTPQPTINRITVQGGNVTIGFSGTLQSSAVVNGTYTDIAGAPTGDNQTYTKAASAAAEYFRSRQ